ncbi:MAG: twin-arginine translocase TatA/TatE family subunit [Desulfurella sp.]|jgi:sec-independent protein translocase protein TatA|uniref:Sec-independent protein translocase protein TatA n=1 Tax=Desulfurella multipotens TaxID=79269 RepID=A0A1G6NWC3_9BACT|nr:MULTISPECIES: twin-arginine translocase TatA/TatE family subunit [Desulfurella]AHF96592.1 preprotein translocase subunit TatA [Desulfurella acetivorans A63]HEX13321.1 twin-arginine translocase TatA/TatE family subunit [Desulfurella acetivorans]PMP69040.1 MAG: twin-arginine translocase TatA/TatE family subunit [Desulfurella multipotens]PMP91684.1 MAG: twin-arginine translocase TatA/TatE family subunit [Desulfurella sp.]SDC72330.1 sec-independent protein translocase protein TatA [Desulfurella
MLDDWHVMVVVLIFALIFGAKKLPEIGSGIGKGIKNFKESLKDEEKTPNSEDTKIIEDKTHSKD